MTLDDAQVRDPALRHRIAALIRSNDQARKEPLTPEERQKLKAAASRLDQMLHDAADADREALKSAAARLDRLLADIRSGKEVTIIRKRQ